MSREPGHDGCLESMGRTITMQAFIFAAIAGAEKHSLSTPHKILSQSVEREIMAMGTGSWCVLEELVKDNYTRFDTRSYHRCRETRLRRSASNNWQNSTSCFYLVE